MPTTDETLYRALIQMGYSPEDAKYRLHDILVEEVSVVDRAANKRRFLMVKSAGAAGANMDDNKNTKPTLSLSKGSKETLLGVLGKSLQDLVEVTTLVKGATDDAADDAALPAEITGGLLVAVETVRGSLAKYLGKPEGLSEQALALRSLSEQAYDLSKAESLDAKLVAELTKSAVVFAASLAKNQVLAQSLQEIAEVSMVLAQMAAEMEEGAELPEDMRAAMEQLAVKLGELAGSGGGESSEEEAAKAAKAAEEAAAAAAAGGELDEDGVNKAVADVSAMLSTIGKAGAKMSASRRKQLRGAMETMQAGFASLMELLADVEPGKGDAEGEGGNVNKSEGGAPETKPESKPSTELTAALARIEGLEAQIKKLAERPSVPASAPETGPDGKPTATKPERSASGQGGPWIL